MNKQQEEWKDKYDDLFGEDHNKICTGKKCNCHSEVKQFISSLLTQARKEAREEAPEEIKATEKILENRNRLFEYIPKCEVHGKFCVPHAIEWINNIKSKNKENQKLPSNIIYKKIKNKIKKSLEYKHNLSIKTIKENAILETLDELAKKNNWKI